MAKYHLWSPQGDSPWSKDPKPSSSSLPYIPPLTVEKRWFLGYPVDLSTGILKGAPCGCPQSEDTLPPELLRAEELGLCSRIHRGQGRRKKWAWRYNRQNML